MFLTRIVDINQYQSITLRISCKNIRRCGIRKLTLPSDYTTSGESCESQYQPYQRKKIVVMTDKLVTMNAQANLQDKMRIDMILGGRRAALDALKAKKA